MTKKILIMGLPGSGKTTLAKQLVVDLTLTKQTVTWFNADEIRAKYNDWDFTLEGRLRQAQRMSDLAADAETDFVIADFVAPIEEMRSIFNADVTVWVNTIAVGRFEDTNLLFDAPDGAIEIKTQDAVRWSEMLCNYLTHQSLIKKLNNI